MKQIKDFLHLNLLRSQTVWRESRRWANNVEDRKNIRVFYGHDRLPKRGEIAGGGIIKCQDLAELFPNTIKDANILYLVSSALPHFASIMVRFAKRRGVRVVVNQNGVAYPGWHGPGWERSNREMKKIISLADFVIYQSEFCKLSADRYLGKYNGPSTVLHNPVDTTYFVPSKIIPQGKKLLLAGSHEHFYRVSHALKMIGYLKEDFPDIHLTVAGRYFWQKDRDMARKEAEQLARSLEIENHVSFQGSYTQENAVSLFQGAHILIHTKYNDPCPRLVVEAMACGLPVVYSASGGVPDLVGKDAGVGIEAPLDWERDHPPDPILLADAVRKILGEFEEFRSAAYSRAQTAFDTHHWLDEHEEIFYKVMK